MQTELIEALKDLESQLKKMQSALKEVEKTINNEQSNEDETIQRQN